MRASCIIFAVFYLHKFCWPPTDRQTDSHCHIYNYYRSKIYLEGATVSAIRNKGEKRYAHERGTISWWWKYELHFIHRDLNAVRYRNDVLNPLYMRHPRHKHFLQDNAPPYRAFATRDCLDTHIINLLGCPCPAKSPEHNVIENPWGIMGTNIRARDNPATNLQEMQVALREEWAAIPPAAHTSAHHVDALWSTPPATEITERLPYFW